jgi:hypothetical protein
MGLEKRCSTCNGVKHVPKGPEEFGRKPCPECMVLMLIERKVSDVPTNSKKQTR